MLVVVTDASKTTYVTMLPRDSNLSIFRNGVLLTSATDYEFGPGDGEVTFLVPLLVGDNLDFRRL